MQAHCLKMFSIAELVVRKEKRLIDKLWEGKILERAEIEYIARKK